MPKLFDILQKPKAIAQWWDDQAGKIVQLDKRKYKIEVAEKNETFNQPVLIGIPVGDEARAFAEKEKEKYGSNTKPIVILSASLLTMACVMGQLIRAELREEDE